MRARLAKGRATLPRLNDATGAQYVSKTQSKDGKCGICGERHLGFNVGDWCLRWNCYTGCDRRAIRDWLLDLGFSDDDLGPFAREAGAAPVASTDYRAECDRLRAELAIARAAISRAQSVVADSPTQKLNELRLQMLAALGGEQRVQHRAAQAVLRLDPGRTAGGGLD